MNLFHERPAWQDKAACKGHTDTFFPERGDPYSVAAARRICSTCPVQEQCLEYAIANGDKYGIWGGMSNRELRAERRRRLDLPPVDFTNRTHGILGTYNAGCRCEPCTEANRLNAARSRAARVNYRTGSEIPAGHIPYQHLDILGRETR